MKHFSTFLHLAAVASLASLAIAKPIAFPSYGRPLEIIRKRSLSGREKRGSCPVGDALASNSLSPSGIYQVSQRLPNQAFGNTAMAIVTPNDFCTIFNLAVPVAANGKTCTLDFLFPEVGETTDPYAFQGPGHFTFTGFALGNGATEQTSWSQQPLAGPSAPLATTEITPGSVYTITVGSCGESAGLSGSGVSVSGMLCSKDTTLKFMQSTNDGCPMGFYVTYS